MSAKKEEVPTKSDGSEQLVSNLEILADVISNRLMSEFNQTMSQVRNDFEELSRQSSEINSRMNRISNTVEGLVRRQQQTQDFLEG
jgi:methyl-accepting chemotaxis protein